MAMKKILLILISLFGLTFGYKASAQTYCTPIFGFGGCWAGDDLDDVTVGTFTDLNTGCSTTNSLGYDDRTNLTINLTLNTSTPITLTSTNPSMFYGIWIDLNSDGDFNDAGEFIWNSTVAGNNVSDSITVTSGAGTLRMRIKAKSGGSPYTSSESCAWGFHETHDYNVVLNSASGCLTPLSLAITNVLDTSATISWSSSGTDFDIEYGVQGFSQGSGTMLSSTTNSINIGGLNALTNYDVYVRNVCSPSNTSGWNGPLRFNTRCATINTYPFSENFDASPWSGNSGWSNGSDSISGCWERTPSLYSFNYMWIVRTGASSTSQTGPNTDASGSGNYMHTTSLAGAAGSTAWLDLPVFDLSSLSQPFLTFKYHMYGALTGTLAIEGSTNGGASWTILDSISGQQQTTASSAWLLRAIDLSSVSSSTTHIRYRAVGTGGYGDIAIDEILVDEAPACTPPTNVSISNIRGFEATLSWSSNDTVFQYEFGPTGFSQGSNTTTVTSTNTETLGNLNDETFYDVYLRVDCSAQANGTSDWLGPYTFRTHKMPDWQEDFSGGFVPDSRWTQATGTIGNPTTLNGTWSSWFEDGWLNNGTTGAARCAVYSSTASLNEWFFTKTIDLGNGGNYELVFDAAITSNGSSAPGAMGADDVLKIVISTDNGQSWSDANTLLTLDANSGLNNSGSSITHNISAYSGLVKFGFYLESTTSSGAGFDFFLDNIGVRDRGACPVPGLFNYAQIASDSLTLIWGGDTTALSYTVEYGLSGFNQGTGSLLNNITSDSLTINNLQPLTLYDFYVRANCDTGTTSIWLGPLTVLTDCPGVFGVSYFTDFDVNHIGDATLGGAMTNCWTANPSTNLYRWKTGDASTTTSWSNTGPADDVSGGGKFVYADASFSGIEAMLVGGPFDLSALNEPTLSFNYHMYGDQMGVLHVDISTDATNWQTDAALIKGEQQTASSDLWLIEKVPLSQYLNDTIYIRLRAEKGVGSRGDIAIDDLSIDEETNCIPPNALTVLSTTTNSATVSWGTYEPGTGLMWGPPGFTQGSPSTVSVHNVVPPYTIPNLNPNTAYDFYVRDTCNPSVWVGPYSFRTECTGALNGAYTIGGSSGVNNFPTLDSALSILNTCGVSGPVDFNFTGGTHMGYYRIGKIEGASAQNTISFNGVLGVDSIEAPSGSEPYTLKLDGAAYVSLNGITLVNNSAGSYVVWLTSNAHHISIDGCELIGDTTSSSSSKAVIASTLLGNSISAQGKNSHHVSITNNRLRGFYYGIYLVGIQNDPDTDFVLENNVFQNLYSYGIRCQHIDSILISGNEMLGNRSTWSGYGTYLTNTSRFKVEKNHFRVTSNGIYLGNISNSGARSLVANNMCYGGNSALYLWDVEGVDIYHNTFDGNDRGGYFASILKNSDIRNNIFTSISDEAFKSEATETNVVIDYNLYHTLAANLAYHGSNSYTGLSDWILDYPSLNANSLMGDPIYLSSTDLHLIGTLANDAGDNTLSITTDIDGDSRPMLPSTTVDIGADEYTPRLNDVAILGFVEPSFSCGDSTTTVSLAIQNLGVNSVSGFPVTVEVSGALNTTINQTYTANLAFHEIDTLVVGTINTYNGGVFDLKAFSSLANDDDRNNDTVIRNAVQFISATPAYLPPDSVCRNADSANFYALPVNGVTYGWYDSDTATNPVDTGDIYTFTLNGPTQWYVGYAPILFDELVTSLNSTSGCLGGIMFDLEARRNISIDSLKLNCTYPSGSQAVVDIYYLIGESALGNETMQARWTLHESHTFTSNGSSGANVSLNNPIRVPQGAVYGIYLSYPAAFLNVSPSFPQVYSNALITLKPGSGLCGQFQYPQGGKQFSGSIYASEIGCFNERQLLDLPFKADTAIASFNHTLIPLGTINVDATASVGDSIYWDFGDGSIATGAINSHVYSSAGTYTIRCISVDTICGHRDTAVITISVNIGLAENPWSASLVIHPNPSREEFRLSCNFQHESDVRITVFDGLGKIVFKDEVQQISDLENYPVNISSFERGVYYLNISDGQNSTIRKLVKL
jgi:hypothetical protein